MEPNFFSDAITTPSDAAPDRKEMNEGRGQGSGKSQSVECGAKPHTHNFVGSLRPISTLTLDANGGCS